MRFNFLFFIFFLLSYCINAANKSINVAHPSWGTTVSATSEYSVNYSAFNAVDGSLEHGNSWLCKDNVSLPQSLKLTLSEPFALTQINIYQSRWIGSMYHVKDFRVEGSKDGLTYQTIEFGTLPNTSDAKWSTKINNVNYLTIRIIILSSYSDIQTCGLGEVELIANVPENKEPLYSLVSKTIDWQTLRGNFKMTLNLEPSANIWIYCKNSNQTSPEGKYVSGPYEVIITQSTSDPLARVIRWSIKRTDNQPFKILENNIECKTSYSGVYKLFNPQSMSQQSYFIDLPFRFQSVTSAHNNHPVVWMQQTDGKNTLTWGLLDQIPNTIIEGTTYDPSNGGEAPGISNSYVRVNISRSIPTKTLMVTDYSEALYVNENPQINWFEALNGYSLAVDKARNFNSQSVSDWALNPMWHSWYAHADEINEELIRDDAIRANLLGVKTIQIDAGWNIPIGKGYSFENEGDYFFSDRFPKAGEMINEMHNNGQRVILHVSPLIMGKNSKAWTTMSDCMLTVNGIKSSYMDPRLKKVQDYLLASWEHMFTNYNIDGLWYDFLEFPIVVDTPPFGSKLIASDIFVAYTLLMQSLYRKALALNPNAVIILRRAFANLNSKTFCTHVWPMDVPQDYNMNRRDVVYMKTFGKGVLTHACCTSWAISESDLNVARQMASITMAGVPAFSNILANSPINHDVIIKAWLKFYDINKKELVLGCMTPLLSTPPSAAIKILDEKKVFIGFFEAMPGLIDVNKQVDTITIVNAFTEKTVTYLEGIKKGQWKLQKYDHCWNLLDSVELNTDKNGGLNVNVSNSYACHSIILTKN